MTKNSYNPNNHSNSNTPRRVAAYARVSTELDSQAASYESQSRYYQTYIKSRSNWLFVGLYSDRGTTGTNYKHRPGFNRMLADALSGNIDLIITKSISRFARNTVDALTVTRELKENGVEVFFEKENISSLDPSAELIFTILSSLAQEESRSISENVRWGIQRRMEAGKIVLPYKAFLGYDKGPDGLPKINIEEAKIIRRIYADFLAGATFRGLARTLTKEDIPTPRGKSRWSPETIRSILTNEKYQGDAILQKTYVSNFLTHEVRKNHGERKQYYLKNSHPAIISRTTFKRVQSELLRRKKLHK